MNELEESPVTLDDTGVMNGNFHSGLIAEDDSIPIEMMLEKIAKEAGVAVEDMLGGSKVRAVVMARRRFIYQALKSGLITGAELARQLNVSQSQITRGFKAYNKDTTVFT
ncbi:hypothetical protein SpAn4DRAFT_1399 [Sporomusa ovata]|uniref:Uncharacterized protein n=2 Tax=Sporomusa ovata TaxID=2378 RepID=A0A0U1KSM7_9FIRM|nr:hypothetical protein SpAn4DRAFT_1399 [Sporomusa ovata]